MPHNTPFLLFIFLTSFVTLAFGLRAVPNSRCASICGNVTTTSSKDIVCTDSDYSNTATGRAFQNCINCELNSTAVDLTTGDSDLKWLLFNIRFAMSSCLWGYPNNSMTQDTPCITSLACGSFKTNIQYNSLSPDVNAYDYCPGLSGSLEPRCTACLQQLDTDFTISNFFTALIAGCRQQPAAGSTLSLAGSLFSATEVVITTPSPSAGALATSDASGGPSMGVKIGIAVSVTLVFLGVIGFCIVWTGKRHRRHKLAERKRKQDEFIAFGARPPLGGPVDTKWVPQPVAVACSDESPVTAGGYGSDKQGFSPYSSKYSSPVSARDMLGPAPNWDWHHQNMKVRHEMSTKEQEDFASSIEMERVQTQTQRVADDRVDRYRLHEEWVNQAAQRGYTNAPPTIKLPEVPGDGFK